MIKGWLNQSKPFFPRGRSFWVYHMAGWSLLLFGIYAEYLLGRGAPLGVELSLVLVVGAIIFVGGTYAGLVFRRWYYQERWHEGTIRQTLPRMLSLSVISSIAIGGLSLLTAYSILGRAPDRILDQSGEPAYLLGFISQGTSLFPFIVGWCLIYLLIKGAQNSREYSIRSLELENSLKEARLDALAGQINPHFLFNALNNIRFIIHEDADRADKSLTSLSEILRHSLESSKKEKIPLSQELSIVEQYLALMKNQMEDRLEYSMTSDPVLHGTLIPPMMMQMLVENAVKHGIDHHKEGGSIAIDCSQNRDRLIVKITNSLVLSASNSAVTDFEEHSGIGLDNIRRRLSLLYGDRAELLMSTHDDHVAVTIELPIEFTGESSAGARS